MRILLDECIPRKFKFSLAPHECQTVPEAGFAGKKNGELLGLAEGNFDVFVTLDKGVEFQQNLTDKKLAVVIIRARSNRLAHVQLHAESCLSAIQSIQPGQLIRVG